MYTYVKIESFTTLKTFTNDKTIDCIIYLKRNTYFYKISKSVWKIYIVWLFVNAMQI